MAPSPPFVDHEEWTIDLWQLAREAIPLVALVGLVGIVASIPLVLSLTIGIAPVVLTLLSQFVLAVGACIVMLYVVSRGIQLAEE